MLLIRGSALQAVVWISTRHRLQNSSCLLDFVPDSKAATVSESMCVRVSANN